MAKQLNGDAVRTEPAHPCYPWKKSLELATAIQHAGGDRSDVPRDMVAHELSMDAASPTLTQLLGSARSFGMIEGRGSSRLTENGRRYFFPAADTEKRQAELAFFGNPRSFKVLIERFDGNTLPSATTLANVLVQSGTVPKSWKDRVAGLFVDAATQLQIVDGGGRLRYKVALQEAARVRGNDSAHTMPEFLNPKKVATASVNTEAAAEQISEPKQKARSANFNEWVFSEAGGMVRVETPNPLPRALWERLRRYVEVLEPAKPENGEDP
jgi:hypothetical protein